MTLLCSRTLTPPTQVASRVHQCLQQRQQARQPIRTLTVAHHLDRFPLVLALFLLACRTTSALVSSMILVRPLFWMRSAARMVLPMPFAINTSLEVSILVRVGSNG